MANLLDYLDWRGDLTLKQSPFNEVDNLILAELAFVDFNGIVPGPREGPAVVLEEAAERYLERFPAGEKIDMGVLVPDEIPDMVRKMARLPRFRSMRLGCFADRLDADNAQQFAALTVETGDGAVYCSFRGTDDTLAGWKEDFHMAYVSQIPAQKLAVEYLETVARQYPRRKLRLGGHSKGGNLAVWSGVFCRPAVQKRIQAVWSNDGPGFHDDILVLPQYRRLADRITTIVPKSSVVGMLLEHGEDYVVVDSREQGLMQHDGFSWQVTGNRICAPAGDHPAGTADRPGPADLAEGTVAGAEGAVCRGIVSGAHGLRRVHADGSEGGRTQIGGSHGAGHEGFG